MTLKAVRQAKELSQAQAAKDLNVSQSYYSAVERGSKNLTPKMRVNIKNKWRVDVDSILPPENGSQKSKGSITDALAQMRRVEKMQVDARLSIALEKLKDVYTDNAMMREALPTLGATDWMLEKFPTLPPFAEYHQSVDTEFAALHSHLAGDDLKEAKVNWLYNEEIEHWHSMLSKIVHYVRQYAKLFRDGNKTPIIPKAD